MPGSKKDDETLYKNKLEKLSKKINHCFTYEFVPTGGSHTYVKTKDLDDWIEKEKKEWRKQEKVIPIGPIQEMLRLLGQAGLFKQAENLLDFFKEDRKKLLSGILEGAAMSNYPEETEKYLREQPNLVGSVLQSYAKRKHLDSICQLLSRKEYKSQLHELNYQWLNHLPNSESILQVFLRINSKKARRIIIAKAGEISDSSIPILKTALVEYDTRQKKEIDFLFKEIKNLDLSKVKEISNKIDTDLCQCFDRDGCNPLHAAVKFTKQDTRIIDWLLTDMKIDPNQTTNAPPSPESALYLATRLNNIDAVNRLVEHEGIQINIENSLSKTPLHNAAESINIAIIKKLLEYGADPTKEDLNRENALHLVMSANCDNSLEKESNIFHVMTYLLECNSTSKTVNLADGLAQNTVSHYLAKHKFQEGLAGRLFQLFKEKGADFELKNKDGNTVLLTAATKNPIEASNEKLIGLLLRHGANPNAANHNNENLLHLLVQHSMNTELIELALEKGANPYSKDQNGLTAETIARQQGNNEIANLLNDSKKYFLPRIIRRIFLAFVDRVKKLFNRLKKNLNLKFEGPCRPNLESRATLLAHTESQATKKGYYHRNIIDDSQRVGKLHYSYKRKSSLPFFQRVVRSHIPNDEIEPQPSTSRPPCPA